MLAAWFAELGEDDVSRMDAAISTLRLPVAKTEDLEEAATVAGENKLLILRLESTEETPSIFTEEVHFLLIRGITEDGKFLVNDPSKDNTEKEALLDGFENGFAPEDILCACTHAWIFDPDVIGENFVPYTK